MTRHVLTPADIVALRLWRSKHMPGSAFSDRGGLGVPYITCSPSDSTFYLIGAHGSSVAGSVPNGVSPAALCAMLYNERLEPGWCASVSDTTLTVEEALRDPAGRLEAQRRARDAAARAEAERRSTADTERARRLRDRGFKQDHTGLTLDDLI